ncbi:unnamed protein product [Cochlearia groenlandica]
MSGNEFGERIHNFFGQEGLSQDQHQSQVVDRSWSSFSNGIVGNQRQIDPSLITNLKSYSTQQSGDPEKGQFSNPQHGLSFIQQPIRPGYSGSLLQEPQNPTNGYMHGNLGLHTLSNEANFSVNSDSSKDKLPARGFTPDLHQSPMRLEMGESPVNYNFFGGQQQLNSQLPGMLQPFPRQQMTFNDMQLLKQQAVVKQMHEYQMQQQHQKQQLEPRQFNSLNSNAVNGSPSSDNHSHPLINGIPLQDTSGTGWQPDLMTGNTNWMHRGISPVVKGSSSGFMINPEHGQVNLLPQQFEPSLYGMPVGGTNASQNSLSSVQMNRLASQHFSVNRSSSLTNESTSFLNQADGQDSHMHPRSKYQEKILFSQTSVPGSNSRSNSESSQQDDSRERKISVQEKFGKMEGTGPSEKSFMKVPENVTASQKPTTLDPTEEKILFGSDDNLWEAFGNSIDISMTGNLMSNSSDLNDACPSLHSGSWSALMQSAVAETSSDDAGIHEWGSKQKSVWAPNNTAQDLGGKASNTLRESVPSDSTQTTVQRFHNRGNTVSDHSMLEKPMPSCSQLDEKFFRPSSSGIDASSCSIRKNEGTEDRLGIWKAASSPNLDALKDRHNNFTPNLQTHRESYVAGNVSNVPRDVHRDIQQRLGNNAGSSELVNPRDLSMFLGGKESQSGQVGVKPSIPRKFQYHPMGNIDVTDEPSQGQSELLGQPVMNLRMDKGHVSQNDMNRTNQAFKGMSSENSSSNQVKSASSSHQFVLCNRLSENVMCRLELLHKVDQSHEHSLESNVSRIPEVTPSAEFGSQFRHSQTSASQEFSLQLAPPSQLAPSPDNMQFSRNSLQPFKSLHPAPAKEGTSLSRFAPCASNQTFPQQSSYQVPFPGIPRESNMTSGFPYSRGYHQNQPMPVPIRKSAANHSVNSSGELATLQVKDRDKCTDIDQHGHSAQTPSLRDSAEGFPMLTASQPPVASSLTQPSSPSGTMSDSRSGISAPQHRFWNMPSNRQPDTIHPHQFPSNNIEDSFSRQEKTNQLSSQKRGDESLSGRDAANMHELQSQDMGAKQASDIALMFSKVGQSNLQTFGHSSNDGSREGDATKMTVNRFEDRAADPQKVAPKGEQRHQPPLRSDDLVKDGSNHKESANHMVHFGQTVYQSFSNNSHSALAEADHQQISPQMAPSWYNQYGTFKNGLNPLKIGEQSHYVGSSVDGTHSVQSPKKFSMQQLPGSTPGLVTPSSESLRHGSTDKLLEVDRLKKRKTATSELLSWNKEVTHGPQRLKTLSEAEVDWAGATNRFSEKAVFETLLEDGSPIRTKRRLLHTTQLLQQLFRPSPPRVISLGLSSNYELVVYTAARAALGDACSSTSTDRSERVLQLENSIPLFERTKTEKINDQYIAKAAEDFINRTRKLETVFAGLENGTTIIDLSVEVQDLERFAVINRFARFHPSSSSMDRNTSSHRLNTQRYVSIAPMPRNIPDRVQCLSL